ncbi:hypothetical protein TanjilG_13822 [Lupinus angustifolius]|uniref:EF-hand domain-containing protein n=1 Tax=Lupinus angustifolius TaxID=3871 RepID=A0A1J7GND5_LUPAN|nr:PREDICTED: probable calcium-binding protein CML25 [Lupinus angustifolius]OIW01958.1 hypothetical protein TanjilG_13822 [Lupinus angustifolius]
MGFRSLFNRKKKLIKNSTSSPNHLTSPIISRSTSVSIHARAEFMAELEQVFKKFDVNGDGKISASELGSIMGSLGQPSSEEELDNMIREVDADGDGYISLDEFIELNTKGVDSKEVLENLKDAFSIFDVDGNGSITTEELHMVMASLGEECSIDECQKMISGVDNNGDGMINFEEFKIMMMGSQSKERVEVEP